MHNRNDTTFLERIKKYDTLLVMDLEATCGEPISQDDMEIIEIGIVVVDLKTLQPTGREFNAFVRPAKNQLLTEFCTKLTTITQKDVDSADNFLEVNEKVLDFIGVHSLEYKNYAMASWGFYDYKQYTKDCALHDCVNPFAHDHFNLKNLFTTQNKALGKKELGMKSALNVANVAMTGTHHRGIDDARNIAKLLPFIFGDKKVLTKGWKK